MRKRVLLALLAAVPLLAAGPCPTPATADVTYRNAGGGCNVVITFNADGSVTTTIPNPNPYDGVEDTLVGVVNNTATPLSSFGLTGSGIFGFDGDGICTFITCTGATDPNGYGPPGVTFIITNVNTGTVHFSPAIGASGGTGFFSLEEPPTLNIVVTPPVPEPGSIVLLGTCVGAFAARFRRRRKS